MDKQTFYIVLIMVFVLSNFLSIYFGFWMGRQTRGEPIGVVTSSKVKPYEIDQDPFSAAMMDERIDTGAN